MLPLLLSLALAPAADQPQKPEPGSLSAGTFAFRFAGPVLRKRIAFPPRAERLLQAAAVVLLTALVATTALTKGHDFVGPARPAGVLVSRAGLAQGAVPGRRAGRRGHHGRAAPARHPLTRGSAGNRGRRGGASHAASPGVSW